MARRSWLLFILLASVSYYFGAGVFADNLLKMEIADHRQSLEEEKLNRTVILQAGNSVFAFSYRELCSGKGKLILRKRYKTLLQMAKAKGGEENLFSEEFDEIRILRFFFEGLTWGESKELVVLYNDYELYVKFGLKISEKRLERIYHLQRKKAGVKKSNSGAYGLFGKLT